MSEGVKRDCQHKRARHEHGTRTAYVLDRCRCTPCGVAASTAEALRRKNIAYGRYDHGRVDAQPVREHLEYLKQRGMGLKVVSRLARVSNATLGKIIYGDPSRNMPPRARVEKHVHDRVMAVRPTLGNLGRTVQVDGRGTRRRLQALVAIGYSLTFLGRRLGMDSGNIGRIVSGPTRDAGRGVRTETARKVIVLYHELSGKPRVGHDKLTRASVTKAKNYALKHRWLPPAAWDDDRLDDPKHHGYASLVEWKKAA